MSTPSPVTLTVAAAAKLKPGLTPIIIQDTGDNILKALAALNANASVIRLQVTDKKPLTVTATAFNSYGKLLDKLAEGITFTVTGMTAAKAAAAQNDTQCTAFSVVDTAAGIAASLGTLAGLGKLSSISVSDGTTLTLTWAQYSASQGVLAKVAATQRVVLTGLTVAQASQAATDAKVSGIAVADSSENIASALTALGNMKLLTSITSTGATTWFGPPSKLITVTGFNYLSNLKVLDKIAPIAGQGYTVIGMRVSQMPTAQADKSCVSFAIVDTLEAISVALPALAASTKLTTLKIADTRSPGAPTKLTLTAAQFNAYADLIAKFNANDIVTVTGANLGQVGRLESNPRVASFTVTDTSVRILDNLSSLLSSKLTAVVLSDVKQLTLTWSQYQAFKELFGLFQGTRITVTGVSVAQAAELEAVKAIVSFSVADEVAAIITNLATLTALKKLSTIKVAGTAAITYCAASENEFIAYQAALDKFTGNIVFGVTNATVATALKALADKNCTQIGIRDTAANIVANLDALLKAPATFQKATPWIVSLDASDDRPVTFTAAQYAANPGLVAILADGDTAVISGLRTGDALKIAARAKVGQITVADTLAQVVGSLDLLTNLAKAGVLGGITLTDSGKAQPATIGAQQLAADKAAIDLISGSYTVKPSAAADTGFHIKLDYGDPSMSQAPTGLKVALTSVVQYFQNLIDSRMWVNIAIKFADLPAGKLAETSVTAGGLYSWADYKAAYAATARGATDRSVLATYANDHTMGGKVALSSAEAKALGLLKNFDGIDGTITFAKNLDALPFSYDLTGKTPPSKYDFVGVALREIGIVLGRNDNKDQRFDQLDLLRYTAVGKHPTSDAQESYLSIDGGMTKLGNVDNSRGAGWKDAGLDAHAGTFLPGVTNPYTAKDVMVLDALGYALA